jgi:hypothetical protein
MYIGNGKAAAAPLVIDGMELLEERKFDYSIPYVDSDVWLEVKAADHWGRTSKTLNTSSLKPTFEYDEACIPLIRGTYDGDSHTVSLILDTGGDWVADEITRLLNGRVSFLMRRPDVDEIVKNIEVSTVFVHDGSVWAAQIKEWDDPTVEQRLLLGTLEAQGLLFTIIGFEHAHGVVHCLFDVPTSCGNGLSFSVPKNGFTPVTLREREESPFLWFEVGKGTLTASGKPSAYSEVIDLVSVEAVNDFTLLYSGTLYFATRLSVAWKGSIMTGPITSRIPVAYIAARPESPNLHLNITQLGIDYYGRSILRAKSDGTRYFNVNTPIKVSLMKGEITDPAKFAEGCTAGLYPPQEPFLQQTVFDSFEIVTAAYDGEKFTLGVASVRPEDGMDSEYLVQMFFARSPGG